MKTYQAVFNEETSEGVFGISLVENPAMEGLFVALSEDEKPEKHEIKLATIDKEERILIGLVLEPNKDVYRNQGGEEFNMRFDEDTIKNLSYHFFKQGHQKNSTIEHKDQIQGVTFVESWLVEDSKIDKSAIHGFSYPVGSWVATMKVDSDDVWNDYVKTGKVQGFSIDAMLELKEVKLKSNISMSNKLLDLLRKIDVRLGEPAEAPVEVTLGEIKSVDGEVTFMYEGDEMVIGGSVHALGEGDEKVAIPVGEYALEGDKVLVVEEEGIIARVDSAEVKEEEEVPMTEPEATPAPANPLMDMEKVKSMTIKYEETLQELADVKEELGKFRAEFSDALSDMKKEVVELAEQPADTPKRVIAQVEMTAKDRILNTIRNKN